MHNKFEELRKVLKDSKLITILSHVNTDGDALGSAIALYYYLQANGKEAEIVIPGDIPPKYHYLDTDRLVNRLAVEDAKSRIGQSDALLILDISSLSRLDIYAKSVEESIAIKICIDHHPLNCDQIDICITDDQKVATGELIYDLFNFLDVKITREIAIALYTSILSDSGGFRYQHTGHSTFTMAAELVAAGVDPVEIYSHVFENGHSNQIRAWGLLMAEIKNSGNLSWIKVSETFLKDNKISLEEIDGLIDILRKNRQAKILAVFVEKAENEILVGLRSKNGVNVGTIAKKFGGGGHYHAAGFTARENLDKVVEITIGKLKLAIDESQGNL